MLIPVAVTQQRPPILLPPVAGAVLHLDASDFSTLTLTASGVSIVRDKSGNGANAIANTAAFRAAPVYHPVLLNNRLSLRFDGSNDRYGIAGLDASDRTQTIFVVANVETLDDYSTLLGANASGGRQVRVNVTTGAIACVRQGIVSIFTTSALAAVPGVPFVVCVNLDTTSWECRLSNGTPESGSESSTFTAARTTSLGENTATLAERMLGHIGEVVVFPTSLSSGDMDLMMAYLMSKWGVS